MCNKPHLLVVDDDDRLRKLLARFLGESGFMVTVAADARDARRKLGWFAFDLMILDVMMPGETGLELLASLGKQLSLPVLMLSALGEVGDRISGLEHGAEDYLAKPFEPKELVLRTRAILRRGTAPTEKTMPLNFGAYVLDIASGQLRHGKEPVYLTTGEAALLKTLAENAGKPVTREELAAKMPGNNSERSVDVQITRLRKKIESSAGKPQYLQTVRGIGYLLRAGGET